MNVNNKLVLGTLTVADVAAGGNIGTAAATVDNFSSFDINQTTAAQTLNLPAPTISEDGQLAFVSNVGTASFVMHGRTIETGTGSIYKWDSGSTSWVPLADPATANGRVYYQQSNLVALTGLAVTHNFNLSTPRAVNIHVRDANGNVVDVRVTAYAANSVTIQSNVAVTAADITVVG